MRLNLKQLALGFVLRGQGQNQRPTHPMESPAQIDRIMHINIKNL